MNVNDFYTQEEMCDLCEKHILGCSSMSSTFVCEGSRCEDAADYILEDDPYDRLALFFRNEKIKKIKLCLK